MSRELGKNQKGNDTRDGRLDKAEVELACERELVRRADDEDLLLLVGHAGGLDGQGRSKGDRRTRRGPLAASRGPGRWQER